MVQVHFLGLVKDSGNFHCLFLGVEPVDGLSGADAIGPVSYIHLRAHETKANFLCRPRLEKKNETSMSFFAR